MEIKKASLWEAVQAFFLVVKNYRAKGYIPSPPTIKNVFTLFTRFCVFIAKTTCFMFSDGGYTLVATEESKVVGTVSLEFNPRKLSVDKLFPREMNSLRTSGQTFVYFGSFAVDEEYNCTRISMRMLKELWDLLSVRGTEVGICVVNPCHSSLYRRFGFRVIATSDFMPGLSQAPAVLLAINANEVTIRGAA